MWEYPTHAMQNRTLSGYSSSSVLVIELRKEREDKDVILSSVWR